MVGRDGATLCLHVGILLGAYMGSCVGGGGCESSGLTGTGARMGMGMDGKIAITLDGAADSQVELELEQELGRERCVLGLRCIWVSL